MAAETPKSLKWQNLDGRQKLEVVDLARRQEVPITELCRTFGVSRQTLHRAMKTADQAAITALSPKPKGRRPAPPSQKELKDLRSRNKVLQQELQQQKLKNQVAQALLDIQRKIDRGERLPGEKKARGRPDLQGAVGSGLPGRARRLADDDDG